MSDMSDTDNYDLSFESDSSQNDYLNRYMSYVGHPHGFDYEHDFELTGTARPRVQIHQTIRDDSSVSDIFPVVRHDSTYGVSEALVNNTPDELDYPDDDSSCSSRNTSTFKLFRQRHKMKITRPKSNYWCLPKELYNRQIGHYNRRAQWGYKFYQSTVGVEKLKLSKLLKGHLGCVNSLDFNNTGEIIASGSDDHRICLWNWSNGKRLLNHNSLHTMNIFQTKFLTTHGGTHIVSSGEDGLVVLSALNNYDISYSKIIARHYYGCNKVSVHHDTPYVVLSCGNDGIVKNIDIRESPINENERATNMIHIKNMRGISMHLYGIDINPMKPYEFIINGDDECVRMYDKRHITVDPIKIFERDFKNPREKKNGDSAISGTNSGVNDRINNIHFTNRASENVDSDNDEVEEVSRSALHPKFLSRITSAVYSYCGSEILASYSEDDIYLFDAYGRSNSVLHSYSGHLNRLTVKGVNFYGPRSDYVVSGSDCGFIYVWDKKTEAIVQRKHADKKGSVNVLEGHPHIPTLATSGVENTIKIWEPVNKSRRPNTRQLSMCIVKQRVEREQSRRTPDRYFHLRRVSSIYFHTGYKY